MTKRWSSAYALVQLAVALAVLVGCVGSSTLLPRPTPTTPGEAPALAAASALASAPSNVGGLGVDRESALESSSSGNALVLGQPGQLTPGAVVGHGRYVLVEKLCDLLPGGDFVGAAALLPNVLPASIQKILSYAPELLPGMQDDASDGQLVPYEGLTRAIAHDLQHHQPRGLPLPAPAFLPAVHDYSVSFVRSSPFFSEDTWGYRFGQRLGKGAFGEAWRAVALDGSMGEVVLKRLFEERGRKSGEREIYYGIALQNRPHISRFISSFERQDPGGLKKSPELWLVFHNEGFSLTQHIFQTQMDSPVVKLSNFWWHVKQRQSLGGQVIKNVIYQLLHAVAVAHEQNITHRDIKLSNVLMTDTWPPVVRLADWGSALSTSPSSEVMKLYEPDGPTEDEETEDYRPPEAMFDEELLARTGVSRAGSWRGAAYDLFGLGVLLLELVLGTRGVFRVDHRRWLRLEHELRQMRVPAERLEQGRQLQALVDICAGPPGTPEVRLSWYLAPDHKDQLPSRGYDSGRRTATCSDEEFAEILRQRDPSGLGFPSEQGRDLLRQLLRWKPDRRISASEALAHQWFDDGAELPQPRFAPNQAPFTASGDADVDVGEKQGEQSPPEVKDMEEEEDECHSDNVQEIAAAASPSAIQVGSLDCKTERAGDGGPAYGSHTLRPFSESDADDDPEALPAASGSRSLNVACPGMHLHVAVRGDMGRRIEMEDSHAFGNLCNGESSRSDSSSSSSGSSSSNSCLTRRGGLSPTLDDAAFVGVYDGHNGDAVAQRLRRKMHRYLASEPEFSSNVSGALRGAFAAFDRDHFQEHSGHGGIYRSDAGSTALLAVVAGCRLHLANVGDCRAVAARRLRDKAGELNEDIDSPNHVDGREKEIWPPGSRVEVRKNRNGELDGQRGTIIEVRSASRQLYIVRLHRDESLRPFRQSSLRLLSELRALRLTEDHKPDTERERVRIQALGGTVEEATSSNGGPTSDVDRSFLSSGTARVVGLATSRSFGSFARRPFVSADPDIYEYELLRDRDVFVILASDGVWDVLDDQLAVDLVWDQLSSVHDTRRGPASVLEGAAELIVKTAIKSGSTDNLTCVVMLFEWSRCTGTDTSACGVSGWASA